MKTIKDLPREIILRCFRQLAPLELKSAVLVSEEWRALGEDPRLWTWCVLTIRSREDLSKLSTRRLRKVRKIKINYGISWQDGDWEAFFQTAKILPSLKEIGGLQYKNLNSVEPSLLARALVKLEKVELIDTKLSVGQITTILTHIAEGDISLKTFNLFETNLSQVDPEILSRAVIKLEELNLPWTTLTDKQVTSIFIKVSENIKLKKLNLQKSDLRNVDPEVLGGGLVRLDEVDLSRTCLSNEQITSILKHIHQSDIKLKKLNLKQHNLENVEPEVLARAVIRLEKVYLPVLLSDAQIISIFTFIAEEETKLKVLNLNDNLPYVELEIFIKAVTKLEEVDLGFSNLNDDQITGIFRSIAQEDIPLKKLNLQENDLANVEPEVLTGAVIRLEEVDLTRTRLRIGNGILTSIAQENIRLKNLILKDNVLSHVDPDVLTRAVTMLEEVDLSRTRLSNAQITGILTGIAQEDTKLKKLNLLHNVISEDQHEVLTKLKPSGLVIWTPIFSFSSRVGPPIWTPAFSFSQV